MKIERDDIWLCDDCLQAAVNDDYSGIDYHYNETSRPTTEEREQEIREGIGRLGWLVPDFDSETGIGVDEFSRKPCGCCGTFLHGQRHRFAVMDADEQEKAAIFWQEL